MRLIEFVECARARIRGAGVEAAALLGEKEVASVVLQPLPPRASTQEAACGSEGAFLLNS